MGHMFRWTYGQDQILRTFCRGPDLIHRHFRQDQTSYRLRSCNYNMTLQMIPGLLSSPFLPLIPFIKAFLGQYPCFSHTQSEGTCHRGEAERGWFQALPECWQHGKGRNGSYGCHRHNSGPFIPNHITSNETLETFPRVSP